MRSALITPSLAVWSLRIIVTLLLSFILLIGLVLNPGILYAKKTKIGTYTIYHEQELDPGMALHLDAITEILTSSEIYDPGFNLRICLNDGSIYPAIHDKLRGPAFGFGFLNVAVLLGEAHFDKNYIDIRGYHWNLDHLFVHEFIHCYQQHYFGDYALWKSNPVAGYPSWKWEGYAEYTARKKDHPDLHSNIARIIEARKKTPDAWAVDYEDGTMAPRDYYEYGLLVHYCMEIKKMDFNQLLETEMVENELYTEMIEWYEK